MQVFKNNQVCKIDMTCFYINFILKENSYVIQFVSKPNQFESLNMSMVPQIENLTQKLDIGNSKKKNNIHYIFSANKIKCDLWEYTANKSTILKRLAIIKHSISVHFFFRNWECLYNDSSRDLLWNIAWALGKSLGLRHRDFPWAHNCFNTFLNS